MQIRYNVRNHLKQDCDALFPAIERSMYFRLRPSNAFLPALTLLAAVALSPDMARAAVLGEPVAVSAIGSPLRVEIAFPGGSALDLAECVRIAPQRADDGLPWVRNARLELQGRGATTRLVVTHPTPVFDPALRLGIEEGCDSRLRRDYTLLLDFPVDAPSAPLVAASPERAEATDRPPPRRAAANRAPRTPRAQATPQATARETRPEPDAPRSRVDDAPRQDRLALGGGLDETPGGLRMSQQLASLDRIGRTTDAEREILRREQAVLMEIDRTIIAQMELNDRIRQLEEAQVQMLERAKQLSGEPAAAPLPPQASVPSPAADEAAADDWLLTAALLILSAGLAAYLIRQRRQRSRHADEFLLEPELEEPAPPRDERTSDAGMPRAPLAEPAPAAKRSPEPPQPAWEELGATNIPLAPIAPLVDIEEQAEEHESAIELAEIMMGFGRIQGAAETLAEFIASNPKRAVTPWLKLLEVYRAADLREEFDALAMQLNKTFNVKAVTWDTFEEAKHESKSIEQMAHITAKVQRSWGTVECQAYLERLLRDNRDGKREGFPLSVIDEILTLADILEDSLGPYRPPPTLADDANAKESQAKPAAETDADAASQAETVLDLPPLSFDPDPDERKDQKLA